MSLLSCFHQNGLDKFFVSKLLHLVSVLISLFQCFFCQYSSFYARIYHYMAYSRRCGRCREFLFLWATLRYRDLPWLKTDIFLLFPLSCWKKLHLPRLKAQLTRSCLQVKMNVHVGKISVCFFAFVLMGSMRNSVDWFASNLTICEMLNRGKSKYRR